MIPSSITKTASLIAITSVMAVSAVSASFAQDSSDTRRNALLEEILVTATKKSKAEAIQDVPVAVTAYGERQLDAIHFRDLTSLSFKMPNVSLDDIGTTRGVANFTIRGLGINSSIPSIDPTVGVFVDGMYLGVTNGVLLDQFDLESVEVLRGPQGLLFGRNVTGGAVLLNTTKPSFETKGKVKASYESGDNISLAGVFSGPLVEDKVAAKLGVYYNNDGGWFENLATGNTSFGDSETFIIRPALTVKVSENAELTVRYEHGETDGVGPISQNRGLFDRTTFDLSIDNEGYNTQDWDQLIAEANIDVAFGDGTITNIFGWRNLDITAGGDIDASPNFLFHSNALTNAEQFSNELRYSGTFNDRMDVTVGAFYYTQDLKYIEQRLLFGGAANLIGGGDQEQTTKAAFASVDYDISDTFTLNVGLRYTHENKSAAIATLRPGGCDLTAGTCVADFNSERSWDNLTPKIGFQWAAEDDIHVYGFYTQGYRSGGYNMRNTSPTAAPGPFDPEKQDSFELGLKFDNADKTIRVNAAVFYNLIDDMQREVNLADPTAGVVQIIDNTAGGRVMGFETEVTAQLHENLTFVGSIGVLDDKYRSVRFDISGDGLVNAADEALQLPRLADVTWGVGLLYDAPVADWGSLAASVNFNHRNEAFYNDANTAILDAVSMLDANISLGLMDDSVKISIYGKNLLNEVQAGGETLLPFGPGQTFSTLMKGRVYGIGLQYNF